MRNPRCPNAQQCQRLAARLGDGLLHDVSLADKTTFGIGGPAALYYEAQTQAALAEAITAAREEGIDYFLLGAGANILVGDRGFAGLVIANRAAGWQIQGQHLRAESGAMLYPDIIEAAIEHGLSGLEHFAGIPSTVGGALWQNLHFLSPAPERSRTVFIEEVLESAEILSAEGRHRVVDVDYFQFGYDDSILHHRADVVLSATFCLTPTGAEQPARIMQENLAWRGQRHPPLDTEPSAGSIFRKIDGMGAGRLIDESGLKGFRHGGAQISPRHANIIVNRGQATAAHVCALIMHVQQTVQAHTGYWLTPEISLVGNFAPIKRIRA